MNYKTFILPLFILLFSSFYLTEKTIETYSGSAVDPKTGEFLYREVYEDVYINGKHVSTKTFYKNRDNTVFAKRTINYKKAEFTPDFTTTDLRTGYIEGATVTNNKIRLFYKEHDNAQLKQQFMNIKSPAIVDAGFNKYIKHNWKKLMSGEDVYFNFTLVSELDYIPFVAYKTKLTNKRLTIAIEPTNIVYKLLSDPIIISYDVNTQRIKSYKGKSNIKDTEGKNQTVKLVYLNKGP